MTKVTVKLHGSLKKYGTPVLEANSVKEAISGIASQIDSFAREIASGSWIIKRNEKEIDEGGLTFGFGCADHATIDVIPALNGGKGGAGKVVMGAALITASIMLPPAGAVGWAAVAAQAGMSLGVGMMFAGASQILSGNKNTSYENKSDDTKTSRNFDGPINSSGQGLPIPRCIGKNIYAGSLMASASITTFDG